MSTDQQSNLSSVADSFRTAAGLPEKASHIDDVDHEVAELAEVPDYGDPTLDGYAGGDDVSPESLAPKPEDGRGNMASDSAFGMLDDNADNQIPGPTGDDVHREDENHEVPE